MFICSARCVSVSVCVCVCACVHVCVDQSAFREQKSHQLFEKREFNIKNC